jgi:hypothetical protein
MVLVMANVLLSLNLITNNHKVKMEMWQNNTQLEQVCALGILQEPLEHKANYWTKIL